MAAERTFHDPENQLREILQGKWGLYLRGLISLDGNFDSDQLRKIADVVDRMEAKGLELVEIERNLNWEDEQGDEDEPNQGGVQLT